MITTTLNQIRKHHPCKEGWDKLLKHLGKTKADDEPLAFTEILDSNGLSDTCWAMRTRPDLNNLWRHFAVDCAERVIHIMTDERSINALAVARRHALGQATDGELAEARMAAAWAANAEARWVAEAASAAANAEARWAARWAARAAAAARAAELQWQTERLRHLLTVGVWTPAIDAAKEPYLIDAKGADPQAVKKLERVIAQAQQAKDKPKETTT
jgi:hypothetical protein